MARSRNESLRASSAISLAASAASLAIISSSASALSTPISQSVSVVQLEKRGPPSSRDRSEEHTSELQSPCNLVCRLLLEKKKYNRIFRISQSFIPSVNSLLLGSLLYRYLLMPDFRPLIGFITLTVLVAVGITLLVGLIEY